MWIVLGLAVFGVPTGVAFDFSIQNMAFIGMGMPLGMLIGWFAGKKMDSKAATEGRQLDWE
jgi:hypothetical protein